MIHTERGDEKKAVTLMVTNLQVTSSILPVAVFVRNKRNILEQVTTIVSTSTILCEALDALLLSAYFTKPASEAELLHQDTKITGQLVNLKQDNDI